MEILIYSFAFLYAVVLGSFLNVVIYRVPQGISVAKGRSYCPSCNHNLNALDLFPVLSYLCLGGKCRYCKTYISLRYPIVELICGLYGIFCAKHFGFNLYAVALFGFGLVLLAISLQDLDTMTIPDGMVITFAIFVIALIYFGKSIDIISSIVGALVIALPMYLSLYAIEDCFGGGDIKLMIVAGFLLGWKLTLLAFFIAVIFGGISGVIILKTKDEDNRHMAFGPYLCLGVFISYLYGERILNWYFGLF